MNLITSFSLSALGILSFSSCCPVGHKKTAEPVTAVTPTQTAKAVAKPYPLDTCMVIGAKLNSTPKTYTRVYNGQEVKFCCKSCIIAFEANPEPFLAKLKKVEE